MDTRNNTPGAEYEKPQDDPQRQSELSFPKLDSSIPLDSLFEDQADPLGRSTIVYYGYPTVGQHVDVYALCEEVIFVEKYKVLLANHLGISIADLLDQTCAKSGYSVFHVRENERVEFEVSVDLETLRHSRTFREKFDNQ